MKISSKLRSAIRKRVIEQLKSPETREVVVRTPYKLDDADLNEMQSSLSIFHDANLVNEVDSSLIGGIVIVDGSMILDYSIQGKINSIIDTLSD